MTLAELQAWLDAHIDSIATFTDYEATRSVPEDLEDTLDAWFDTPDWRVAGHRFISLGQDGTGGQIAAWLRPTEREDPAVVLFGSEGGRGVLAGNPARWAQVLAHEIGIDEFAEPARAVAGQGWSSTEEDPEALEEMAEALATYRAAVEERFGPLPALEDLIAQVDLLNAELEQWIESVLI